MNYDYLVVKACSSCPFAGTYCNGVLDIVAKIYCYVVNSILLVIV